MITQIDFYILNAIQSIRTEFLDALMPIITYLGSGGIIWIVAAVIMLFFRKSRKTGITVLFVLVIGWLLSTVILKCIIVRERPFNTPGALLDINSLLIPPPSDRFSFPSGHALSSFSVAAVMLFYDKKIGISALILASLISFSRLYLYVHFPTDVIGGMILGFGFAFAARYIIDRIWEKTNERKLSNKTEQDN